MDKKLNFSQILTPTTTNFPKMNIPNIEFFDKDEPFRAKAYYERLIESIVDFEKELEENEEVGAKLVTFGESLIIHIDDIGYYNPRLICFYGQDSQGQKVQLIQHVNQISVLLITVKRVDTSRPRIGYVLSEELKKSDEKESQE